jgi:hypothetical protein
MAANPRKSRPNRIGVALSDGPSYISKMQNGHQRNRPARRAKARRLTNRPNRSVEGSDRPLPRPIGLLCPPTQPASSVVSGK